MLFIDFSVDKCVLVEYNIKDRYWDEALCPHDWIVFFDRDTFGCLFFVVYYNGEQEMEDRKILMDKNLKLDD